MAFLLLHRWRDRAVVHLKADAVIAISTVESEPATNGYVGTSHEGPATVLRMGCGAYSEWVCETPADVLRAIAALRAPTGVAAGCYDRGGRVPPDT